MKVQDRSTETFASTLLAENNAFYKRVKSAYQASNYFADLPLNLFWGGENMALLERLIGNSHSPDEKVREILATDLYSHGAMDPEVGQRQIEWWLQHLREDHDLRWERLPEALQESTFVAPESVMEHAGGRLTPDFLRHLTLALEVQRRCPVPAGPANVLELGAGYGGFARILKTLRPQASYVVVDIPETLYFSSLFLRLNFPDAKVHYVTELPKTRLDVSQYDFVFVPTIFADAVLGNQFHLFYNTCSLGEMKNAVIRYWMNFAQAKLDVRYFFGVNRYLNTIDPQVHAFRLEENEASVSFDAHWRMVHWELEPAFTRCPYHETFATRNLHVVAERLPAESRSHRVNQKEAERLAARLSKQDWLVHADHDNTMRLRDNFLAHDLGQSGALFHLWESIRLSPSVDNVSMMLVLLYQLRRERPFEEMFYYLDKLEALRREPRTAQTKLGDVIPGELLDRHTLTQLWGIRRFPELAESGSHGYNLVRYRTKVFALSQALGPVNLTQLTENEKRELCASHELVVGESVDAVKKAIDALSHAPVPKLVKENYRGFNFVQFGEKIFALALALGPVELEAIKPETLAKWQTSRQAWVGNSIAELAEWVNAITPAAKVPVPSGSAHPNYRFAEHKGLWYAIPKHLGPLNVEQPAERNLPEVLSARSRDALDEVISRAPRASVERPTPQLLESNYHGYRLFTLQGIFLATTQRDLDIAKLRSAQTETFFSAVTLSELKHKVDASRITAQGKSMERVLIIGTEGAQRNRELLEKFGYENATVLVTDPQQAPGTCPGILAANLRPETLAKLRADNFELVVVPYGARLGTIPWESLIGQFCRRLLAVFPDGSSRLYEGDQFSRLLYNMAYLRSMYSQLPSLAGQKVLEVGCSDGLTCDLVAREGASSVVGVDLLETVGLLYQNPRCAFHKLDAATLPFADQSFDVVYSIATFEHVSDPLATLREMKRVLRPGGYGYVQSAPLYYSPFGHHMFGYFDRYPWIHVRLSKTEIAEFALAQGIAAAIEKDHGGRAEDYIEGMINLHHINGKLLHEYRLQEFANLPGVEVVRLQPSYEGEPLLTPEILAAVRPVKREDLITHGFELVFRAN